MKKITLFIFLAILAISCGNDDNTNIETDNGGENNTVLKLKEYRAITTSQYFYHTNGFVDSISIIGGGLSQHNANEKYHYNSENKLTSIETWIIFSSNIPDIYYKYEFEYNDQNQISAKLRYDTNQNLTSTTNYTYNSEGYLNITGRTYSNGNLVQVGNIIYAFDDKRNPFYEMHPVAYNRISDINKNNQTSYGTENETLEVIDWTYNENNYPISFQKSPIFPDDVNYATFIYY